jgi:hypothetical protein
VSSSYHIGGTLDPCDYGFAHPSSLPRSLHTPLRKDDRMPAGGNPSSKCTRKRHRERVPDCDHDNMPNGRAVLPWLRPIEWLERENPAPCSTRRMGSGRVAIFHTSPCASQQGPPVSVPICGSTMAGFRTNKTRPGAVHCRLGRPVDASMNLYHVEHQHSHNNSRHTPRFRAHRRDDDGAARIYSLSYH